MIGLLTKLFNSFEDLSINYRLIGIWQECLGSASSRLKFYALGDNSSSISEEWFENIVKPTMRGNVCIDLIHVLQNASKTRCFPRNLQLFVFEKTINPVRIWLESKHKSALSCYLGTVCEIAIRSLYEIIYYWVLNEVFPFTNFQPIFQVLSKALSRSRALLPINHKHRKVMQPKKIWIIKVFLLLYCEFN